MHRDCRCSERRCRSPDAPSPHARRASLPRIIIAHIGQARAEVEIVFLCVMASRITEYRRRNMSRSPPGTPALDGTRPSARARASVSGGAAAHAAIAWMQAVAIGAARRGPSPKSTASGPGAWEDARLPAAHSAGRRARRIDERRIAGRRRRRAERGQRAVARLPRLTMTGDGGIEGPPGRSVRNGGRHRQPSTRPRIGMQGR